MSDFLQRYEKNPILKPIPEHRWESKMVFNPAAVIKDNKVYLIYRARGEDKSKEFWFQGWVWQFLKMMV